MPLSEGRDLPVGRRQPEGPRRREGRLRQGHQARQGAHTHRTRYSNNPANGTVQWIPDIKSTCIVSSQLGSLSATNTVALVPYLT